MIAALLMGAIHGLNPAMGWLFAVFLAAHRRRRAELFWSLLPIALGHGLSVALVAAVAVAARSALPVQAVRYGAAAAVLAFGLFRLARWWRHVPWRSLNVGYADLVLWSFLGATAHGSGLMLAPFLLHLPGGAAAARAVLAHTAAMLATMAGVAVLVHDRLWLGALRRWWLNFDLIWALALVAAGGLSLLAAATHSHA